MRRRPAAALHRSLLLAALVPLAPACATTALEGPVARPEIYPDRTSPAAAWRTFLWAWKAGDVDVLLAVTGWKMHGRLEKRLGKNGREAVSRWYRSNAQDLVVREAQWKERGDALAYLRVVLASSAEPRVEVDFSFVRRPDGWVLTAKRAVR